MADCSVSRKVDLINGGMGVNVAGGVRGNLADGGVDWRLSLIDRGVRLSLIDRGVRLSLIDSGVSLRVGMCTQYRDQHSMSMSTQIAQSIPQCDQQQGQNNDERDYSVANAHVVGLVQIFVRVGVYLKEVVQMDSWMVSI